MALLAGLNGTAAARQCLFALTGGWLAGALAGLIAGQYLPVSAMATTLSFLVLGIMVAADPRLSPTTVTLIAAAVGILHGWVNGAGIAKSGHGALALAGILSAVFVVEAVTAAAVVSIQLTPARLAVRVAGSWVAAIGLLMLGWGLRTA
jgi:hydrogenase/urease accessory protein HupE